VTTCIQGCSSGRGSPQFDTGHRDTCAGPERWRERLGILRTEGLVFTVPRRGTYVSPDAK